MRGAPPRTCTISLDTTWEYFRAPASQCMQFCPCPNAPFYSIAAAIEPVLLNTACSSVRGPASRVCSRHGAESRYGVARGCISRCGTLSEHAAHARMHGGCLMSLTCLLCAFRAMLALPAVASAVGLPGGALAHAHPSWHGELTASILGAIEGSVRIMDSARGRSMFMSDKTKTVFLEPEFKSSRHSILAHCLRLSGISVTSPAPLSSCF